MSYRDIINESKTIDIDRHTYYSNILEKNNVLQQHAKENITILPEQSVDILSPEVQDWIVNKNKTVLKRVLDYAISRRLNTAINRPKSLYASDVDFLHYGRLILPFYASGALDFYQSRSVRDDDEIRYIGKRGGDKTIFGYDNIDSDHPYVYIFEGPIDSCYVKNGVSIAGLPSLDDSGKLNMFTHTQREQMAKLRDFEKVWVLDNIYTDASARRVAELLVKRGEKVFGMPPKLAKYKDFGDLVQKHKVDEVPTKFIHDNLVNEVQLILST